MRVYSWRMGGGEIGMDWDGGGNAERDGEGGRWKEGDKKGDGKRRKGGKVGG